MKQIVFHSVIHENLRSNMSHKQAVWKTAAFTLSNESDIVEMLVSFSIDSSEIMTLDFDSVSFKPQVVCQLLNTYYRRFHRVHVRGPKVSSGLCLYIGLLVAPVSISPTLSDFAISH